MYPTEIRGLAFGLANTFGRLATIMSALMVNVEASVFMWMNVGQSLLIIFLTCFLPETKGVQLEDKINKNDKSLVASEITNETRSTLFYKIDNE